jgi:hypothetical protein
MSSHHKQQTAAGKKTKGKDNSKARKRRRQTAEPVGEDVHVGKHVYINTGKGGMELTQVTGNAGNGTYEVRHARQGTIVNSQDIRLRVNELATRH